MRADITMTIEGALATYTRANIRKVIEAALREVGDYWHRKLMPKHFQPRATREYGYSPRKGQSAWPGSKLFRRVAGPAERRERRILPLVYSGKLRAGARTRVLEYTFRRDKLQVRVVMPKARRANIRPRNAKHINMREELTTISEPEKAWLVDMLNRRILRGLKALPPRKIRRRIRG